MKNIKSAALIGLLAATLVGCGDEDVEVDVSLSVNEVQLNEGMRSYATISTNMVADYQVTVEQLSGPKTYVEFDASKNAILVIGPSVDSTETATFRVSAKSELGEIGQAELAVTVEPTEISPLLDIPLPNPFSSGNVGKHLYKPFDDTGVPLTTRPEGDFYYIVSIAAYAYDLYNYYYHNRDDQETLDKFLVVAKWLKDNCQYTEYGFCSYRSDFPIEAYELTTDWTSAMGQGQAISSLVGAYYLTGDDSYAQVAKDAVSAFFYPIKEKGLSADFEGVTWYEEYGSESMQAHVLNGSLFALSGVNDFYQNFNSAAAKQVFDVGADSIEANIGYFDHLYTSRYDYSPLMQFASSKKGPDAYHELHVLQLGWLYNVTNKQKIYDYAHKFLKQDMAGFKLVNTAIYNESIEILEVTASDTANDEILYADRIRDGFWTYNRYWASYSNPVDLRLKVNPDILDAGVLEKIAITSVTAEDLPNSFDVYQVNSQGQEVLVKENIQLADFKDNGFSFEVGGYLSHTVVYDVNAEISSDEIILRFADTDSGLIKIRELDLQYPRQALMEDLLDFYR